MKILKEKLSPETTIFFKETNPYHPEIVGDRTSFGIVIENWETGEYRFVNSIRTENSVSNTHFTPLNQKPLKTIEDLNNLWKVITGDDLTYIGREKDEKRDLL